MFTTLKIVVPGLILALLCCAASIVLYAGPPQKRVESHVFHALNGLVLGALFGVTIPAKHERHWRFAVCVFVVTGGLAVLFAWLNWRFDIREGGHPPRTPDERLDDALGGLWGGFVLGPFLGGMAFQLMKVLFQAAFPSRDDQITTAADQD